MNRPEPRMMQAKARRKNLPDQRRQPDHRLRTRRLRNCRERNETDPGKQGDRLVNWRHNF